MSLTSLQIVCTLVLVSLLAACASQNKHSGGIIIDKKGVNMAAYHDDLQECQSYAEEISVAQKTGTKAAGGAVIGGAMGAIWGNSDTAAKGAGAGGLLGGVKGFSQASREKQQVVKRCLRGRGYRVLN